MKILRIAYKNIGLFKEGFEIDFTAVDRVTDRSLVHHIYKSIYTQKVIGITGPNASGKTTVLKLLQLALNIAVNNTGLDHSSLAEFILQDDSVMQIDFSFENKIFRLESLIGLKDETLKSEYYFKEETIYSKPFNEVEKKADITSFSHVELKRSEISEDALKFLKPHDSIISTYIKWEGLFLDTLSRTNNNTYYLGKRSNMNFVNLFDDSIEEIHHPDTELLIKFKKNKDSYITTTRRDADKYLSSGTIRGNDLLTRIAFVIIKGGFMIIDEIENHLHKKLVELIIDLFTDENINKNGAILIFTSHYAELFDTIERKDNIYVLKRDDQYNAYVYRYSDLIKRNDIKKSEILLSNYIDGTSPKYEAVAAVKETICRLMKL